MQQTQSNRPTKHHWKMYVSGVFGYLLMQCCSLLLLVPSHVFIEASSLSQVASCHKGVCFRNSKFYSVWLHKKRNSCTTVLPNTCASEQQDWNKTIKDKGEEGKKKEMNVERSTVGSKKSRQPKRQKSLKLVQSRQSLTTVRQEAACFLSALSAARVYE